MNPGVLFTKVFFCFFLCFCLLLFFSCCVFLLLLFLLCVCLFYFTFPVVVFLYFLLFAAKMISHRGGAAGFQLGIDNSNKQTVV